MSEDTNLVFVGGASRSGTTMLARSLGLHDKLHTLRETHFFGEVSALSASEPAFNNDQMRQILARLFAAQTLGVFHYSVGDDAYELADEFLQTHEIKSRASLFESFAQFIANENAKLIPVEQTPRNIFYARALLEQYPNSRFIEMVRDPRAVLLSQRKRWRMRFSGDSRTPLIQAIRVFINYHAITMSYLWVSALKSGLRLEGHPRFLSLRYEDVVQAPERNLRKICSFLGVNFQEKMLLTPQISSSNRAVDRETRGFYQTSVNAWQHDLPRGDQGLCEIITRKVAARRGYHLPSGHRHILHMIWHMLRYPIHVIGISVLNPRRTIVQIRSVFRGR